MEELEKKPLLSLKGVGLVEEGKALLKGIDLELRKGESLALLGPSLSGKSALLSLLSAKEAPTEGRILLNEEPLHKGMAIAYLRPAALLFRTLSVKKALLHALKGAGTTKEEGEREVLSIAKRLDLESLLEKKCSELNELESLRLDLAFALLRKPNLLLLDEPLRKHSAYAKATFPLELRKIQKDFGISYVLATKDPYLALLLGDRIAFLNHGSLEQVGTSEELYLDPTTRLIASYVGNPAYNLLRAKLSPEGLLFEEEKKALPLPEETLRALKEKRKDGDLLTFAIRPENLRLSDDGIPMNLSVIEKGVGISLLHFDFGNADFVLRPSSLPEDAYPGATLKVAFDLSKARYFDPESGKRLL